MLFCYFVIKHTHTKQSNTPRHEGMHTPHTYSFFCFSMVSPTQTYKSTAYVQKYTAN